MSPVIESILKSFSSRDYASLLFCSLIFISLYNNIEAREALNNIRKIIMRRTIITIMIILTCYMVFCILVLLKFNIWNTSLAKDTVIWFIFCAFPQVLNVGINQTITAKKIFIETFSATLILTTVLEFFANFFTFNIAVEFLIILAAYLFYISTARSRINNTHSSKKIELMINIVFAFTIFSFTAYKIFTEASSFFTVETLIAMFLPFLLSILFFPILILFYGYFRISESYSSAFIVAKIFINNKAVLFFSKFYAIIRFNLSLNAVEMWKLILPNKDISSMKDSFVLINEILRNINLQKQVDCAAYGWEIEKARGFLNKFGFKVSEYKADASDWFASAKYLIDNQQILNDSIFYYMSGTNCCVTSIDIILTIYQCNNDEQKSLNFFIECFQELSSKLFIEKNVYRDVEKSITEKQNYHVNIDNLQILTRYEQFPALYTFKISINNNSQQTTLDR